MEKLSESVSLSWHATGLFGFLSFLSFFVCCSSISFFIGEEVYIADDMAFRFCFRGWTLPKGLSAKGDTCSLVFSGTAHVFGVAGVVNSGAVVSSTVDDGPGAVDDGPAAAVDDGPAAAVNDGPGAVDGGPAAAVDDGPGAVDGGPAAVDDGPAAAVDDGPGAVDGGPAAVDDGPAAAVDDGPGAVDGGPAAVDDGPAAAVDDGPCAVGSGTDALSRGRSVVNVGRNLSSGMIFLSKG